MRPKIKFNIGSNVFFKDYDDYVIKDYDMLCIMDNWLLETTNVINSKKDKNDIFYFKDMTLEEFIEDTLTCKTPLRVGKFLIPEFVEYIHMTIKDLQKLEKRFDELDDKHKYEKVIYDSYIKNNSFTLTDEQRQRAYAEYKKYR